MKRLLRLAIFTTALLAVMQSAGAQSAAREAGYLYLSPVPGASYVSAQTRYVLVRFEDVTPAAVTNLMTSFLTVTGANSGPHSGVTHVASDGRTVIFEMSVDFTQNELVTVTLNPQVHVEASGTVEPYEFQFMITALLPGSLPASTPLPVGNPAEEGGPLEGPGQGPEPAGGEVSAASAEIKPNGVSVPSDFPAVMITVNSNPSPGYLFLETGMSGAAMYTMMLDNKGLPVWYRRGRMYDFKIQKNGIITWCLGDGEGFPAFDENFNYIRTYLTTNGYLTDGHDLKVLEDGSYLMLGYRTNAVNLSKYIPGGSTSASVRETVIQEFTAAGELIFQWRSWDNYDIRLSGTDFTHMNALEIDEDGHILVSARQLSEVTKINRDTGEIIWRLSGTNSSFTFVNDSLNGTRYQHDISALGNGHYMVFDNGNGRSPQVSRAVEYQLNLANMTATLVWQFRDTPDKYAYWLGNAQRLPTGNTLINFARPQYPKAIEVDTNGVKRFELSLVPNSDAYRTFRFPWNGAVAVPYLILEPQQDSIILVFNKFGDTNVAYYRIYGGTSPEPTTLLATSTTTLKHLTYLENGRRYYFRVSAVDGQGVESGYSNEEDLIVNIIKPGGQTVRNGDFAQGTSSWIWTVTGGASALWRISNGVSCVDIASGGSAVTSVQLRQASTPLFQGRKNVFEFDAWSQAPRYIEAKVGQAVSPYVNYSGIGFSYLTPTRTHYRYVFTMQAASDFNSSVIFNLGASVFDVYLDNVSLFNAPPGDFNLDGLIDFQDLAVLTGEWLKQLPNLSPDLDGNGRVDFRDFAVFGESWNGTSP
jgi:hypothetical protein